MNNIRTVWPLEPHTKAKHEILRYYLGAWFPIMATGHQRILYVDGFAGPGEYKDGEDGSPLIALKVARDHMLSRKLARPSLDLVFVFIEQDEARYKNLKRKLTSLKLPTNFRIECECGTFEKHFGEALAEIETQSKTLAPSFVFIDPFGPTGFSMDLISRLSRQPRCEVLVNFNYQALNQWFLYDKSKHGLIDTLYGNDTWRAGLKISNPRHKEQHFRLLYQNALEGLGWRVRPFRMVNKHNQTQYYLFFATSNALGMRAMKNAMWSAAPAGDFQYSDLTNPNQARLFEEPFEEQYSIDLAEQVYQNRKGTTVKKEDIVDSELAWYPICIDRHLTRALRYLEYDAVPARVLDVETPSRKRKERTYPADCIITFAPESKN